MLLLTYRSEHIGVSPCLRALQVPTGDEDAPVQATVVVEALSPGETLELARGLLGGAGPSAEAQAEWVVRESGGSAVLRPRTGSAPAVRARDCPGGRGGPGQDPLGAGPRPTPGGAAAAGGGGRRQPAGAAPRRAAGGRVRAAAAAGDRAVAVRPPGPHHRPAPGRRGRDLSRPGPRERGGAPGLGGRGGRPTPRWRPRWRPAATPTRRRWPPTSRPQANRRRRAGTSRRPRRRPWGYWRSSGPRNSTSGPPRCAPSDRDRAAAYEQMVHYYTNMGRFAGGVRRRPAGRRRCWA